MPIASDVAYPLHRRAHGNTSLLVDIFSLNHGRFPAIAKGARAAKRGASGLLQPFSPLQIDWSGNGEVKTLRRFEVAGEAASSHIALHGARLYCGFYINELLARLLPRDDPHAWLFGFYQQTLVALSGDGDVELALRRFELALLDQLGHRLNLETTLSGEPLADEAHYLFPSGAGAMACKAGTAGACRGSTLLSLSRGEFADARARGEAKHLLRRILGYHLEGRPLKSRELFGRNR